MAVKKGVVKRSPVLVNAWLYGVAIAVFLLPLLVMEVLKQSGRLLGPLFILYIALNVILIFLSIMYYLGFVYLGQKAGMRMLVFSSFFMMGAASLSFFFGMITLLNSSFDVFIYEAATLVIVGAGSMAFGISLFGLEDVFGRIAKVAGLLNIIAGFLYITIVLAIVGFLFFIAASVVEIILLYKASRFSYRKTK